MTDFEELTKTLIQTQVLAALKEAPQYVDDLIKASMSQPVNQYGGSINFGDQKMPWLEWCVRDTLRKATQEAIVEVVREMEPSIKESVRKSISSDQIVSAFVKKILLNSDEDYKINVSIETEKR